MQFPNLGKVRDDERLPSTGFNEIFRWFLYDAFTDITYGESLDFTGNESDIGGILRAFRSSAWIIGLMTMFPWILGPLFNNPILKRYFLPKSSDAHGFGKIMMVKNSSMAWISKY